MDKIGLEVYFVKLANVPCNHENGDMQRRQRDRNKILKLLLYWFPFIGYIIIISPSSIISYLGFYFLLSISLFITFKSFFSQGRTFVWLGIILIYLLLRQFHLDNILNTIILMGIFLTFEIYFRKT